MYRGKARRADAHWNFWDQLEPKPPTWIIGFLWAKVVPFSRGRTLLAQGEGGSSRGWKNCGQAAALSLREPAGSASICETLHPSPECEKSMALLCFHIPDLTLTVSCDCQNRWLLWSTHTEGHAVLCSVASRYGWVHPPISMSLYPNLGPLYLGLPKPIWLTPSPSPLAKARTRALLPRELRPLPLFSFWSPLSTGL